MKYKLLIIFIFITSCASNISNSRNVKTYESKGFAYIYNEADYSNKLISTKADNTQMLVYHNNLKKGSIVKLLNPDNKKSVILKIAKKSKYPEFYKIMITETVANKLSLNLEIPFIEIQEIKKNKSFVAKKAKTFNEEKKISNTAPVTKVKIDNISTIKKSKSKKIKKFAIIIGEFSSIDSVNLLKKRLIKELPNVDSKIFSVNIKNKKVELLAGPYKSINILKKNYIKIKKLGFEDLDVKLYE